MATNGKGLAAIALILGLIGAGAGGFIIVKEYFLTEPLVEEDPYISPIARVSCQKSGYHLTSGLHTVLNFTHTSYDTHNAYNFTDDSYIIPEDGFYQVFAQFSITAEDGDFFKIYILQNDISTLASVSVQSYTAARSTNTFTVAVTDIVNATAGDTIYIWAYSHNIGNLPRLIYALEDYTYFTITKIA